MPNMRFQDVVTHDVAAQQKRLTIGLLSLASRVSLASWAGGAAGGRKRTGLSRSRRLLQKAFRPMPQGAIQAARDHQSA